VGGGMYHELARELRKNLTDTERLLWSKLRGKQFGGFKFRKQAPIGRYIVDFVCFDRKVIVELDGGQHVAAVEADKMRTEWLGSQGFRVLRFWNHEVIEDTDTVMEAIWLALQMPPTLTLPHKGGGELRVEPSPTRGEGN
jgi:very-short-patch-repair endonuclease